MLLLQQDAVFKDMHVFMSVAVCECMLNMCHVCGDGCPGEPECLVPLELEVMSHQMEAGTQTQVLKSGSTMTH